MPTKTKAEKKPRAVRKSKTPKYVEDALQLQQQQRQEAVEATRALLRATLETTKLVEAEIQATSERARMLEQE